MWSIAYLYAYVAACRELQSDKYWLRLETTSDQCDESYLFRVKSAQSGGRRRKQN